jgi:serine/threonine protein kinase
MTLPDAVAAALADRYQIERSIGTGGMAVIYLARDLKHDRMVAIKVLRPAIGAGIGAERFLAEIRITAALQHPHILPLFDSGEAAGRLYFVTPFIEGESLRERLTRDGALPVMEAVRLLREVADALAKAHRAGVIHRDIKPENILVADGHALVSDFGVARAASSTMSGGRRTTAGTTVGTPAYMAPEQATADGTLDHRADLYGFGVLAFETLAGRPPFHAPNPQALIAAHLTQSPPRLQDVAPQVSRALSHLVDRCLEKRPEDRWPDAAHLVAELDAVLAGAGTGNAERALPGRLRIGMVVALVLALLALAIALMP